MNLIDFDFLLGRMAAWDHAAFTDFEDVMRDRIADWLRGFGLPESVVVAETPRCLLALGVMAVQRRGEIEPGRFLAWCHVQTRNLTVPYYRETDAQTTLRPALSAHRVRGLVLCLNGNRKAYGYAARMLGVVPGWLRRRHQKVLTRALGNSIPCCIPQGNIMLRVPEYGSKMMGAAWAGL